MPKHVIEPFTYEQLGKTPPGYRCDVCAAEGVRLYRWYQTVLDAQKLFCRSCAVQQVARDEGKQPEEIIGGLNASEHAISWLVAAVPTECGDTFWGFLSVPGDGVAWWDSLPKEPLLVHGTVN